MTVPAELPADEELRLQALYEYDVLGKPTAGMYLHISQLACELLGVIDAGIAFVDRDDVWFGSQVMDRVSKIPRGNSFAAHAILQDEPFVVPDLTSDERFKKNPLVLGEPNSLHLDYNHAVRFFAGVPLKGAAGYKIGTFGVLDSKPRVLTSAELAILKALASVIVYDMDLRLMQSRLKNSEEARAQTEELYRKQLLVEKLASMGQVTAGVAHEINTPLQFVVGNLTYLKDSFSSIMQALNRVSSLTLAPAAEGVCLRQQEEWQRIEQECDLEFVSREVPQAIQQTEMGLERVLHVVGALKRFSHSGNFEKDEVQLNDVIKDVVLLSRTSHKQSAELRLDLAEDLPLVMCDCDEIGQVLLNLVTNSADAVDERWGKSSSDAVGRVNDSPQSEQPGRIVMRSAWGDGVVTLEVEDNGGGIPEAIIDKIFEPFYTTKLSGKGTGQGLAISRDVVVRRHGGQLEVSTDTTAGWTVFRVILPISG